MDYFRTIQNMVYTNYKKFIGDEYFNEPIIKVSDKSTQKCLDIKYNTYNFDDSKCHKCLDDLITQRTTKKEFLKLSYNKCLKYNSDDDECNYKLEQYKNYDTHLFHNLSVYSR